MKFRNFQYFQRKLAKNEEKIFVFYLKTRVNCGMESEEKQKMSRQGDSIYHRKDGSWEARYVKEIDASGKKKYGSVYAKTRREAKEKRQAVMDNILLYQTPLGPRNITVGRLVCEWLCINRQRVKISTLQRYKGFWKNHIEKTIGARTAISCTTIVLHEFALERMNVGLSPVSVNTVLAFLHTCFKYGHRQYKLPMPDIIYFPREKGKMRVLSQEEQSRLESYLLKDMDIYKFGVLLTLYTGLRIGELCALQWRDVNGEGINVRKTMQRLQKASGYGSEIFVGSPKTKTSERTIPLPLFLFKYLDFFKQGRDLNDYVLSTDERPVIEPRVMQLRFKKYMQDLDIEGATFHTLRHSFATRCVDIYNFEIKTLSEILGHSTVEMTLNRYVHSSMELKRSNMERLQLLS